MNMTYVVTTKDILKNLVPLSSKELELIYRLHYKVSVMHQQYEYSIMDESLRKKGSSLMETHGIEINHDLLNKFNTGSCRLLLDTLFAEQENLESLVGQFDKQIKVFGLKEQVVDYLFNWRWIGATSWHKIRLDFALASGKVVHLAHVNMEAVYMPIYIQVTPESRRFAYLVVSQSVFHKTLLPLLTEAHKTPSEATAAHLNDLNIRIWFTSPSAEDEGTQPKVLFKA